MNVVYVSGTVLTCLGLPSGPTQSEIQTETSVGRVVGGIANVFTKSIP